MENGVNEMTAAETIIQALADLLAQGKIDKEQFETAVIEVARSNQPK